MWLLYFIGAAVFYVAAATYRLMSLPQLLHDDQYLGVTKRTRTLKTIKGILMSDVLIAVLWPIIAVYIFISHALVEL